MGVIIFCIVAILWLMSYRFVVRKATDVLRDLNYPVSGLDNYASAEKRIMLLIVSPAIAANYLLGELRAYKKRKK